MDPHLKDILRSAPTTLKPLYFEMHVANPKLELGTQKVPQACTCKIGSFLGGQLSQNRSDAGMKKLSVRLYITIYCIYKMEMGVIHNQSALAKHYIALLSFYRPRPGPLACVQEGLQASSWTISGQKPSGSLCGWTRSVNVPTACLHHKSWSIHILHSWFISISITCSLLWSLILDL